MKYKDCKKNNQQYIASENTCEDCTKEDVQQHSEWLVRLTPSNKDTLLKSGLVCVQPTHPITGENPEQKDPGMRFAQVGGLTRGYTIAHQCRNDDDCATHRNTPVCHIPNDTTERLGTCVRMDGNVRIGSSRSVDMACRNNEDCTDDNFPICSELKTCAKSFVDGITSPF